MHRSFLALAQTGVESSLSPPPSGGPTMLGAFAGDIIGSVYENCPIKHADFGPLFQNRAGPTDDSILTAATTHALISDRDYASACRSFGRKYPRAGYGASFVSWFREDDAPAYNSWGNGSAMRVSPVGWAFETKEEVLAEAERSAAVTHNHPEGIKGAQATALAVYMARNGSGKDSIKAEIEEVFGYDLSRRVVDIRPNYKFDVSCQGSVPEAIICFLEAESVEDAIRAAISLGGDSDTQACIAGAIAEAHFGPLDAVMVDEVRKRLSYHILGIVDEFEQKFLANKPSYEL
mmetsp:Transcript_51190/g.153781  ORF Transcript_51190/g.153781 Transcript_51190/m.153781 type:complete len:291 (-) Transcript_51190:20-892(-)